LGIIDQLNSKRRSVGMLIINLAKRNQEQKFAQRTDQIVFYGDRNCKIPYFLDPPSDFTLNYRNPQEGASQLYIRQAADFLSAGLGLGNPFDYIIKNILEAAWHAKAMPENLGSIFEMIPKYLEKNPYAADVYQNLLQAYNNRRYALVDETFLRTTRYLSNKRPEWFDWWMAGKSIYLDLSPCVDEKIQRFLMFGLINLMQTYIQEQADEENGLQYLVIIDEAHRVFSVPPYLNTKGDENFALSITTRLLNQFLREYRSRGIGMILADQNPSDMIPVTYNIPNLSIMFNLSRQESSFLTSDVPLQFILEDLPYYTAFVQNRASGERYFIRTCLFDSVAREDNPPETDDKIEKLVEWFYQKLISNPAYYNELIATPEIYEPLNQRASEECSQKAYLSAARLIYGISFNRLAGYYKVYTGKNPPPKQDLWALRDLFTEIQGLKIDTDYLNHGVDRPEYGEIDEENLRYITECVLNPNCYPLNHNIEIHINFARWAWNQLYLNIIKHCPRPKMVNRSQFHSISFPNN
jgi:hypothetical protein